MRLRPVVQTIGSIAGAVALVATLSAAPADATAASPVSRPQAAQPSGATITSSHDPATDIVTLSVRGGAPSSRITVSEPSTGWVVLGDTDQDGASHDPLSRRFGARASVDVQLGDGAPQRVVLRHDALTGPTFVFASDGTVEFQAHGEPDAPVSIGTGPLETDVVATGSASGRGAVAIPVPGAQPGATYTVHQQSDGVRSKVVVPARMPTVAAVDGPGTVLDRNTPTPVPVGVQALEPITRITGTLTLTAPAGTVFVPATVLHGEARAAGGAWSGLDDRFLITSVDVSGDGRSLTAASDLTMPLGVGDELRWWPALEVLDPATAPTHV